MNLEFAPENKALRIDYLSNDGFLQPEMTQREYAAIDAILSRDPWFNHAEWIIFTEGRRMCIEDPIAIFPTRTDGARECIWFGGGFYRPLQVFNGMNITHGSMIELPSPINFAKTRPDIVTTCYVGADGMVHESRRDYVPTGGYTLDGARQKARNTEMMRGLTESTGWLDSPRPYRPFVVPQVIGVYSFADLLDVYENPISGIAMFGPHPRYLFACKFRDWINANYSKFKHSDDFISAGNVIISAMVIHLTRAARYLHDYYGRSHGQLTLGNCGELPRNKLNRNAGDVVYITDWDTVRELPKSLDDALLARALELSVLWKSAVNTTRILFLAAGLDLQQPLASILYKSMQIGMLNTIVRAYEQGGDPTFDVENLHIGEEEEYNFLNAKTPQDYAEVMRAMLIKYCPSLFWDA